MNRAKSPEKLVRSLASNRTLDLFHAIIMPSFKAFKAFNVFNLRSLEKKRPWAVKFRSSEAFVTFVVWESIFTDLLVYSIIVPGIHLYS